MNLLENFKEITTENEPLASLSWMKIGGAAQYFVQPRNEEELVEVVNACQKADIPIRMLGAGSNVLIRDEGVKGAVFKLGKEFAKIRVEGDKVHAGGAANLSEAISESVKAELSGLENLVGIPGTVGGAVHGNAGGKSEEIGQFVESVEVLTEQGERFTRSEDELSFGYRSSSVNELAILQVTFALKKDNTEAITSRMKKLWIMKKATQPLSHQSAGCIFKNPRGLSAGDLVEQCGLKGTRVGEAEISDRHANFIVTHEGTKSDDVLELIDLAKSKVAEQFGVDLELEIEIW